MEQSWPKTYAKILNNKADTVTFIENILQNADNVPIDQTVSNYKKALSMIDDVLSIPVPIPVADVTREMEDEWIHAYDGINQLKQRRSDIILRLTKLESTANTPVKTSKENNIISSKAEDEMDLGSKPKSYKELNDSLSEMQNDFEKSGYCRKKLDLIFSCDNVNFYRISSNGTVGQFSPNQTFRVVRMDGTNLGVTKPMMFMQIIDTCVTIPIQKGNVSTSTSENSNGLKHTSDAFNESLMQPNKSNNVALDGSHDFLHPLVAGMTPCLKTEFGAFIFPDLQSNDVNAAIGLVFPEEVVDYVTDLIQSVLPEMVIQPPGSSRKLSNSENISANIVKVAQCISNGLVYSSTKTGELMTSTTPYLISKIRKGNEYAPVSAPVKSSVEAAKKITGGALSLTGFVANKVSSACYSLGQRLAPHIHSQGSKILTNGLGYDQGSANETMNGILTVAAGTVEGFGTIYNGLETSASILGSHISNNSVKIIEHKYGNPAGNVAAETFDTVGNLINISRNVKIITPKGMAKKAVKTTGAAVVMGHQAPNGASYIPADSMFPNLMEFSKTVNQTYKKRKQSQ